MPSGPSASRGAAPFSEKGFYLSELRDRTIGIVGPARELAGAVLAPVLEELAANRTRVVLVTNERAGLEPLAEAAILSVGDLTTLSGRVWRCFAAAPAVGVLTSKTAAFPPVGREVAVRLGLRKVVWVDAEGGLTRDGGGRDSFIDVEDLRARIRPAGADAPRAEMLREIEALLDAGLSAVNLCTASGVADELFTYDGSGTLFTCEGYVHVRSLGLDDFDAAADLVERGMSEGYLAPRSQAEIDRVLEGGIGAFVNGHHLAGIGTLLLYESDRAAEIASLYTLTRFLGEGVGGHLVRHAIESARARGCDYVFACTTSDRVVAFFERNGFEGVGPGQVPELKWQGYDPERRGKLRCLRCSLAGGDTAQIL